MRRDQLSFAVQKYPLQYGGILRNKAKNRGARPLSTRESMHIVMRSSHAKGEWSFRHSKNIRQVTHLIQDFSSQKGVSLIRVANVGNHIHLHVRIPNRALYCAWIRGLSSALAMLVAGLNGLKKLKSQSQKFWDYRPFTRVIRGLRAQLTMRDYMMINQLEGSGEDRSYAVLFVKHRSLTLFVGSG